MVDLEFDEVMQEQFSRCIKTLSSKAVEYADVSDRLHNFKIAGTLQQTSPEAALLGMMTKHIISIYDMVTSKQCYHEDVWDEKIGDAINYLILLRALVKDTGKLNNYEFKR